MLVCQITIFVEVKSGFEAKTEVDLVPNAEPAGSDDDRSATRRHSVLTRQSRYEIRILTRYLSFERKDTHGDVDCGIPLGMLGLAR